MRKLAITAALAAALISGGTAANAATRPILPPGQMSCGIVCSGQGFKPVPPVHHRPPHHRHPGR
jgi:hypothetical protein